MKAKRLFIICIIILLVTKLLVKPPTEEEKYCDQFSGESNADEPSENFNSCQTDLRCKVEQDSLTTKNTDPDVVLFMCIPEEAILPENTSQRAPEFPE